VPQKGVSVGSFRLYFASLNEIDRGELSNNEQNGGEIESAAIMIDADHAHRAVKTK
jgi:hypothetical protein